MDAHTHIFPPKIAEKATVNIGHFYDIPMAEEGNAERLLQCGAKIGTKRYLVCSTATTSHQVESINDFIAEECGKHPEFYGFGTLHPDYADLEGETNRIIRLGLHGIKLHPDFQRFDIDSPGAYKIYEQIAGRLPVLIHMGDDRYAYSKPERLARVMRDFPTLRVMASHDARSAFSPPAAAGKWPSVPVRYRDPQRTCSIPPWFPGSEPLQTKHLRQIPLIYCS